MQKIQITIPQEIKYLSDYPCLLNQIPPGKIILDKTLTGCGATSLFLADDIPTILCSPRKALMYCKAESHEFKGKVHLFRCEDDDKKMTPVIDLENRMMEYVRDCQASVPVKPEKILVSYDSFKHVAQRLHEDGSLFRYRVVVDEAHTLFTDAAFKGGVEIEFLRVLQYMGTVIYLSATPYMEEYLDCLPEFKGLPYVELVWPESSKRHYNIVKASYHQGSIKKTTVKIIENYQKTGYFAEKLVDGTPVYATEAVFFLNEVRTVLDIIREKRLGLTPENTNVICAFDDKNKKMLSTVGFSIGKAPVKGAPHKTFTFATRCAFEGVDFYNPAAYTYIFSDIRQDHMALDLTIDLVQILGRLRIESNPFCNDATLFYKTGLSFSADEGAAFRDRIKSKYRISEEWRDTYDNASPAFQQSIISTIRRDQGMMNYEEHYATAVDNTITGSPEIVVNDLAVCNECRAWQIQMAQYQSIGIVMASIEDAIASIADDDRIATFLKAFSGDFEARLKTYCEFLIENPGYKSFIESLPQIPMQMKTAFNTLGPDRLRALSYVQADINRALQRVSSRPSIQDAVRSAFLPGKFYSRKEVKEKLQGIYDKLSPGQVAKASDIEGLGNYKECKKSLGNGTRERGYRLES